MKLNRDKHFYQTNKKESKRKINSSSTRIDIEPHCEDDCFSNQGNYSIGSSALNLPTSTIENTGNGVRQGSDFIIQVLGTSPVIHKKNYNTTGANTEDTEKPPLIKEQTRKKTGFKLVTSKPDKNELEIYFNPDDETLVPDTFVSKTIAEALSEVAEEKTLAMKVVGQIKCYVPKSTMSCKSLTHQKPFNHKVPVVNKHSEVFDNIVLFTKDSLKSDNPEIDPKLTVSIDSDIKNNSKSIPVKEDLKSHSEHIKKLNQNSLGGPIKDKCLVPKSSKISKIKDGKNFEKLSKEISPKRQITSVQKNILQLNQNFDNQIPANSFAGTKYSPPTELKLDNCRNAKSAKTSLSEPSFFEEIGLKKWHNSARKKKLNKHDSYVIDIEHENSLSSSIKLGTLNFCLQSARELARSSKRKVFSKTPPGRLESSTNSGGILEMENLNLMTSKSKSASMEHRKNILEDLSLSQTWRRGTLKALAHPKTATNREGTEEKDILEIVPKKKYAAVEPIANPLVTTDPLNQNRKLPSINNSKSSATLNEAMKPENEEQQNFWSRNFPSSQSSVYFISRTASIAKQLASATLTLHDADELEEERIAIIADATNVSKEEIEPLEIIDFEDSNQDEKLDENDLGKNENDFILSKREDEEIRELEIKNEDASLVSTVSHLQLRISGHINETRTDKTEIVSAILSEETTPNHLQYSDSSTKENVELLEEVEIPNVGNTCLKVEESNSGTELVEKNHTIMDSSKVSQKNVLDFSEDGLSKIETFESPVNLTDAADDATLEPPIEKEDSRMLNKQQKKEADQGRDDEIIYPTQDVNDACLEDISSNCLEKKEVNNEAEVVNNNNNSVTNAEVNKEDTAEGKEIESNQDSFYLQMPLTLSGENTYPDTDDHSCPRENEEEFMEGPYSIDLNEEEELARSLHRFIEDEGIDHDLYERYLEFLQNKEIRSDDLPDGITSRNSDLMSSNHGSTISLPCSLQFCSCCEEELRAKVRESRKDQCDPKLALEISNGRSSHAENTSRSQSGEREAGGTATESIQKRDDPKGGLLTVLPSSVPQVTVANSQLISSADSSGEAISHEASGDKDGVSGALQSSFHIDLIREKKDLVLHARPLVDASTERSQSPKKKKKKKKDKTEDRKQLIGDSKPIERREPFPTRIPVRVGSDMLARFGPSNNNIHPANGSYGYPANAVSRNNHINQRLPPLGRNDNKNQRPANARPKTMFFDFLNPFKRKHHSRNNNWGRVPIAVKPSPVKPQKGYEYEDLLNKRKRGNEKRRNSAGKIYIQDPNDRHNILIAEEIGYVYGDPRKNIAPMMKQHKVERGIQTAVVRENVAPQKNGAPKNNAQPIQKPIFGRKRTTTLQPPKKAQTKPNQQVSFVMDLQAASKLETPREKGDYVIYPSRNLPKLKSKNVSFKEAERGIKSISSTIPENPKERLYNNRRDVAIDLPPPHFYDPYHHYHRPGPVGTKGYVGGYSNGIPPSNRAPVPMLPKPVLERRASFDGKLPPVKPRSRSDPPGQFFNQIQHSSSQPNLSQNTNGAFLPPPIPYADSPLRTHDDPPLVPGDSMPSQGKGKIRGWGRVKELTMKSKDDTTIDMPYGSTTDLLRDMPGRRSKGPNVPIVLLQGFFKGGPKFNANRRPSDAQKNKVSMPKTLLEPNSLLRGALPVLPTYLAAICLFFNIFVPGLGTMMSGWFGYCGGRTRLGPDEKSSHRVTSVIVTAVTGFAQLFTVTFFFVGWFWSISWGIILVSIAKRYKKFMIEHRASKAKSVGLNMLTVNTS